MLPSASGLGQHFQDLGLSFSLYGPPSRPITYIYVTEVLFYKITEILRALSLVHKCVLMKVCKHGCDVLDWSDFEKRQF